MKHETPSAVRAIVKVYCTHFSFRIGRINRGGFIRDSPTFHRHRNNLDNRNLIKKYVRTNFWTGILSGVFTAYEYYKFCSKLACYVSFSYEFIICPCH